MKIHTCKTGVTLVEMLIVVAIIAILVTMVISIATRVDTQGKEQLAKNTLSLLDAALGQFQDYGYEYKIVPTASDSEMEFYRSLDFPIDCNGLQYNDLRREWARALGSARGTTEITITGGTHDPNYSGSEVLYFFLNMVPESRRTLDKIDRKLITALDENGNPMEVIMTISGGNAKEYPLFRFIDPWGTTLRYDYYDETETNYDNKREDKRTFPVITSAGPDREFGTDDDIASR